MEKIRTRNFVTCKASGVLDWLLKRSRSESIWPLVFGDSCCSLEYSVAQGLQDSKVNNHLDFSKYPSSLCDLLIISGPINHLSIQTLVEEYRQMKSPKWVIALGACAISGGPFSSSYNIIYDLENYIPVDIVIPGCPPEAEAIITAISSLKSHIRSGEFKDV